MFVSCITGFVMGLGVAGLVSVFAMVFHVTRDCGDI